jgi:hypothetical protein
MSGTDGYVVDQQKVHDGFGGEVELGKFVRDACSLEGARVAGPPIATVATVALEDLLQYLGTVVGQLGSLLSDTNDDVRKSMERYAEHDRGGKTSLDAISAQLGTPAGTNPHDYLASHEAQISRNLAEVRVWNNFDPSKDHPVPGTTLTTSDGRLLTVGQDGVPYDENRRPVDLAGKEVRMYQRMTPMSGLGAGGVA